MDPDDIRPISDPILPPGFRGQVVVKFLDTVQISYQEYDAESPEAREQLLSAFPNWNRVERAANTPLSLVRVFASVPAEQIQELVAEAQRADERYPGDRLAYFSIPVPPDVDPRVIAAELNGMRDQVEVAYVQSLPTRPPVLVLPDIMQNPHLRFQNHLKLSDKWKSDFSGAAAGAFSAVGIGARYAWCFRGGDGAGVRLVDVEQGWFLNHEDFEGASINLGPGGGPTAGHNYGFFEHGTSVLGILVSRPNNGRGGVGIAPAVSVSTCSEWATSKDHSIANALVKAATLVRRGDVILLESQVTVDLRGDGTAINLFPSEVEPAVFDAIRCITLSKRIVVAAAGNSGFDLDQFAFLPDAVAPNWQFPWREMFPTSGSILVGACQRNRNKKISSNFGRRIDAFASGVDVSTTVGHPNSPARRDGYGVLTDTSAASAIVAGAVASIQGVKRGGCLGGFFGPEDIRGILRNPNLNTPSADALAHPIGLMPNLARIIRFGLGLDQRSCPAEEGKEGACLGYALTA